MSTNTLQMTLAAFGRLQAIAFKCVESNAVDIFRLFARRAGGIELEGVSGTQIIPMQRLKAPKGHAF